VDEPPGSGVALGKEAAGARDSAVGARDAVAAQSQRIAELVAQRKAPTAAASAARREWTKHEQAAARAGKTYQAALKKDPNGSEANKAAETARTEYAAAIAQAELLMQQTKELAATDEAAASTVATAVSSAESAKNAQTAAAAALAKLKALSDEAKHAALSANQQLTKLRAQSGVATPASAAAKKVASDKAIALLTAQLAATRQSLEQLPGGTPARKKARR
jgi:hypothetical protein